MNCPECSSTRTVVLNKSRRSKGKVLRLYSCPACSVKFQTKEEYRVQPRDETIEFQLKANRRKYG